MRTKKIVFTAPNRWTVREVRYVVSARGLLVQSIFGEKWLEVYDSAGRNFCNYRPGEATLAHVCEVARRGEKYGH